MTTLRYKTKLVEDLAVGECTMHSCESSGGPFWHLWCEVVNEVDGQRLTFCVPMKPNGSFDENGPGGKTWGLTNVGGGSWQVSPSINVLHTGEVHPGVHVETSLWHQTPIIVGVPDDAPWITDAP